MHAVVEGPSAAYRCASVLRCSPCFVWSVRWRWLGQYGAWWDLSELVWVDLSNYTPSHLRCIISHSGNVASAHFLSNAFRLLRCGGAAEYFCLMWEKVPNTIVLPCWYLSKRLKWMPLRVGERAWKRSRTPCLSCFGSSMIFLAPKRQVLRTLQV